MSGGSAVFYVTVYSTNYAKLDRDYILEQGRAQTSV